MAVSDLVDQLVPGDHVCWAFEGDETRDDVYAASVRAAVAARQRVSLFTYATTPEQSLAMLAADGIDVDGLVGTGQLTIVSTQEAYFGGGHGPFDPASMISTCLRACDDARADGFTGLRLIGDMGWATVPVPGVEHLGEYEAQVNRVYAEGFAIGLCLYDQRLFPPARLTPIRTGHPGTLDPSTTTGWAPLLRLRALDGCACTDAGAGIRLEGEADLSNRGSVLAMLDTLAGPKACSGPATVDVSTLTFIDVATAHSLIVTALRLGGLRVVGASAPLRQVLSLLGADQVPELVIAPAEDLRQPA